MRRTGTARHAQGLSVRELEFLGLREVQPAAPGGRSDVGARRVGEPGVDAPNEATVADSLALLALWDGLRPAWQAKAACRGRGVARFFPARGYVRNDFWWTCAGCGVAWECLGYGLEHGCVGVWGGFVLNDKSR